MRRRLIPGVMTLILGAATIACAEPPNDVTLRNWYLGLQGTSGRANGWDVFGSPDLPPAPVEERGSGGGFVIGHRFGDRFLLGLQLTLEKYHLVDHPDHLHGVMALVTGTVLFRERRTLQPFLRGGFGGGGAVLRVTEGDVVALGPAVTAGGGLQVRLSSRFSLEWEIVADFRNIMEVQDQPDEGPGTDRSVRASHQCWRSGLGIMFWF